ncbi:MAG: xanthine dehydrogenase family protein molybdopterin-binding subunit [Proteobacteria bacterium]|nr:xanthine dehydrogenase family protein molybdopterin-binding subunit [Pseudomonadota bacterium]
MKIGRRNFLYGGLALAGAGVFGVRWSDHHARAAASAATVAAGEGGFTVWLKIAADDVVTVYSPHIDFGQGSHTGLAQMAADELDADWAHMRVEQAPAIPGFATVELAQGFLPQVMGDGARHLPKALVAMLARNFPMQLTGGSTALRFTGQMAMRAAGAAARAALVEEAAERLGVPAGELTTAASRVTHARSGRSLRYGELAEKAAARSLPENPPLKTAKDFKLIGQSVPRMDIPAKVDGSAQYGMDIHLPGMKVATIMMAPVRGGKLTGVDDKPAMAVKGVEKVVRLDDAVAVVASGYWPALKGLRALSPQFSDGGHGTLSSAAIATAQDQLRAAGKPDKKHGSGDVAAALAGGRKLEAVYRAPFVHHAMMEPFAATAHFKDGKLELWIGLQDPLATRTMAAKAAGIGFDDVTLHTLIMGGGFGRRFPDKCQIIGQVVALAKAVDGPVKLIWSREEELRHGTYRPQVSGGMAAALDGAGKLAAWRMDYVQSEDSEAETRFPYQVPATARQHFQYQSNQDDGPLRSVNSNHIGFFNECFMDEMAHTAGQDPYKFRRAHLPEGSRHAKVLDAVAEKAGWGSPLPAGHGRGIALVESFGTIVAEVVEASVGADGAPVVHKVTVAVDCGTTVNPRNAEAQIQGAVVMALSMALGEEITLDKGAVVQSNFSDYPLLKLAGAPATIAVHFLDSGAEMGGIGEPGVPPTAPALANALFAATGKRIRQLPIRDQASLRS